MMMTKCPQKGYRGYLRASIESEGSQVPVRIAWMMLGLELGLIAKFQEIVRTKKSVQVKERGS